MSIKNGDLPAMPVYNPQGEVVSEFDLEDMKNNFNVSFGLSKREQFAMAAMQGLLVNMGRNGIDSVKQVAEHASCAADALLAELEKSK